MEDEERESPYREVSKLLETIQVLKDELRSEQTKREAAERRADVCEQLSIATLNWDVLRTPFILIGTAWLLLDTYPRHGWKGAAVGIVAWLATWLTIVTVIGGAQVGWRWWLISRKPGRAQR